VGVRLLKVNESIKEALSAAIGGEMNDPRIGFVTVTGVETTRDLRHARVFVSVLGKAREREATLAGLRASHGYLQARVAESVRMKRTPQLEFVYDTTTDKAIRMEGLLKRYEGELMPVDEPGQENEGDEVPQ
jgi:ribosome-binding factor A